jgi:hypothetical protein
VLDDVGRVGPALQAQDETARRSDAAFMIGETGQCARQLVRESIHFGR